MGGGVTASIDWPATLGALADAAQVVALIVAGFWTYRLFVRQRVDQPRADLSHVIYEVPIKERRLVRVTIEIRNVGHVVITPSNGNAEISTPLIGSDGMVEWKTEQTRTFDFAMFDLTLEPGEAQRFPFDFVVAPDISLIRIRTRVRVNRRSYAFWEENTVHVLGKV